MGFSGSLEDLPVVDVLQFVYIARRSGTLRLTHPQDGEAIIAIRDGRIISASYPKLAENIGGILVARHGVKSEVIGGARALQEAGDKRPLGVLLVEEGSVTGAQIEAAMVTLIELVVQALVGWTRGAFAFEPGSPALHDDIACFPEAIRPDISVDVQGLLLEALRVMDEQKAHRDSVPEGEASAHAAPAPPEPTPPATVSAGEPAAISDSSAADVESALLALTPGPDGARRAVVVISNDGYLKHILKARWKGRGILARVHAVEHEARREIGRLLASGVDVVGAVDLTGSVNGSGPATVKRLRDLSLGLPILAVAPAPDREAVRELLRVGARTVLEKPERGAATGDYDAEFVTFLDDFYAGVEGAFGGSLAAPPKIESETSELTALVDMVEQLRTSAERTAVALALLEHVAKRVQRAVLFLCRQQDAIAIGAFSHEEDGKPFGERVVGVRLKIVDAPLLRTVIDGARPYQGAVGEDSGLAPLYRRILEPATQMGLFVPVRTLERVVAILYGDNGTICRPLMSTESLQILASQAGLMLENMALKKSQKAGGLGAGRD